MAFQEQCSFALGAENPRAGPRFDDPIHPAAFGVHDPGASSYPFRPERCTHRPPRSVTKVTIARAQHSLDHRRGQAALGERPVLARIARKIEPTVRSPETARNFPCGPRGWIFASRTPAGRSRQTAVFPASREMPSLPSLARARVCPSRAIHIAETFAVREKAGSRLALPCVTATH